MDYATAQTADYEAMTKDAAAINNLSFLVNNVGFFTVRKLLDDVPNDMQTELKVNLRPITLLTSSALKASEKRQ